MIRLLRPTSALLAPLLLPAAASGQVFSAPFGPGGTWNLYAVGGAASYLQAKQISESAASPIAAGKSGHLATASTMAELLFIREMTDRTPTWLGLERAADGGEKNRPAWKWITGEPMDFSHWAEGHPRDRFASAAVVATNNYGSWSEVEANSRQTLIFVTEWETQSSEPVLGAMPYRRIWNEDLTFPKPVAEGWSFRWVNGTIGQTAPVIDGTTFPDVSIRQMQTLMDGQILLANVTAGGTIPMITGEGNGISLQPLLVHTTQDSSRQGWLATADAMGVNFPGIPRSAPYIAAISGIVHVETAGTYTFSISAEDSFALRVGGLEWKSATGTGFIDPLDPKTVAQPYPNQACKVLAAIDLPAGDHVVHGLCMTRSTGSEFHVLTAPGTIVREGDTADWRLLGHRAGGDLPWPGITDAGWTVECLAGMGDEPPKGNAFTLQEALVRLRLAKDRLISKSGLPHLNFSDHPELHPAHFSGTASFPNQDEKGRPASGPWPLHAKATLVVPAPGLYTLGIHACGSGALRVKGAKLAGPLQTSQTSKDLHLKDDFCDFNLHQIHGLEPKLVTLWQFARAGEHEIEIFYLTPAEKTAELAVFSSPFGPYPPELLRAGGAGMRPDVDGLPLAAP